jgi:hypothetical protein
MIDVSPDSPPWTWPSSEQIDQLVKDCDDVLFTFRDHWNQPADAVVAREEKQ